jgi:hypothetical protein
VVRLFACSPLSYEDMLVGVDEVVVGAVDIAIGYDNSAAVG